ncbi:hypothetical protein HYW74_01045 [Candidatus Pacearchaeota archaeon]|nr:hypothetical protein [Candidatus Pacearchaeota archaeon]
MDSYLHKILEEMRAGAGSVHGQERAIQPDEIGPLETYKERILAKYHGINPESD